VQKINFILKLGLAFFLYIFALLFDSVAYNLVVVLILITGLTVEKISPFRFPKQIVVFSIFLLFIFLFQAVNGYGKILLALPLRIAVTKEGLFDGFRFVTQILLIFLLFGAAVYSSKKSEILYYFRKAGQSISIAGRDLERFTRIGMFSIYMIPVSLKVQQQASSDLKSQDSTGGVKLLQRINRVLDSSYYFFHTIISTCETEYKQFVLQSSKSLESVKPLLTIEGILISIAVLLIHGILIWQRL
jgi:hypothetical protein